MQFEVIPPSRDGRPYACPLAMTFCRVSPRAVSLRLPRLFEGGWPRRGAYFLFSFSFVSVSSYACGYSRLSVTPPPIVRLSIGDPSVRVLSQLCLCLLLALCTQMEESYRCRSVSLSLSPSRCDDCTSRYDWIYVCHCNFLLLLSLPFLCCCCCCCLLNCCVAVRHCFVLIASFLLGSCFPATSQDVCVSLSSVRVSSTPIPRHVYCVDYIHRSHETFGSPMSTRCTLRLLFDG